MLNASPNPGAQADQLYQQGNFGAATRAYRKLLAGQPRNADLLHRLGLAEMQDSRTADAVKHLREAIRLRPSAPWLADLGQALTNAERYDEAERAYDQALDIDPDFAFAMGSKVELHQLTGDYDKAEAVLAQGLARFPDDLRLALALARLARRLGKVEQGVSLLERHLERGLPSPDDRMRLLFRLGELYDALGAHDKAFETAREANALAPGRFSVDMHRRAVDLLIAGWSPKRIRTLPRSGARAEIPLFIVGMPRSGTSLVEQILSCHPRVHAAGELTAIPLICLEIAGRPPAQEPMIIDPSVLSRPVLDRHAMAYLASLSVLAPHASRVTDKLPSNYLHLGLIDRMLPRARVVHCVRDPRDTCLSCYFQHFRAGALWSYRLEWLGAYYRQYQRVMDHWSTALPDLARLDVPYERLVTQQEEWSRRIVEFAGLEWNDACLRFHESKRVSATLSNEQVRRPMYTSSIARHKNYDHHLRPLNESLGVE